MTKFFREKRAAFPPVFHSQKSQSEKRTAFPPSGVWDAVKFVDKNFANRIAKHFFQPIDLPAKKIREKRAAFPPVFHSKKSE